MDQIRQTELPGVGSCLEFETRAGRHVGVVVRPSGRRELVVYADDDPDTVVESVDLAADEARMLGEALAEHETTGRGWMDGLIEGLAVDWIEVPETRAPSTIGDLAIRTRTGASVVAVVTDGVPDPEPGPETPVGPGSTIVVIGTPKVIESVVALLDA